jgi:hypothetical protein
MKDLPYTLDLINTDGINEKGMELLRKLNISRLGGYKPHKDSIMLYEEICTCDDAYLCEHRLQVIADWIKENQK